MIMLLLLMFFGGSVSIEPLDLSHPDTSQLALYPDEYQGLQNLPDPLTAMQYEGFDYPLYEISVGVSQKKTYLYPPQLILGNVSVTDPDRRGAEFFLRLFVQMWTHQYRVAVVAAVQKALNSTEEPDTRILPIRWIRTSGRNLDGLWTHQKWTSYQGECEFGISFTCDSEVNCRKGVQELKSDPRSFLHKHDLKLYFGLDPRNQTAAYEEYLRVRIRAADQVTVSDTSAVASQAQGITESTPILGPFGIHGWTAFCTDCTIILQTDSESCAAIVRNAANANPPVMGYYRDGECFLTGPDSRCMFYFGSGSQIFASQDRISRAIPNTDVRSHVFRDVDRDPVDGVHWYGGKGSFPGIAETCLSLCKVYLRCNLAVYTSQRCYLKHLAHGELPTMTSSPGSITYLLDDRAFTDRTDRNLTKTIVGSAVRALQTMV